MIMENVELAHEMMVVGGMITNPDRCIDFALANLGSESFADTDLGLVFDMVSKRYRDKQSVQPDSLLVDLRKTVGDHACGLLADIIGQAMGFDHWNFPYYVSRVQDSDHLRQLETLKDTINLGISDHRKGVGGDPEGIAEEISSRLAQIGQRRSVETKTVYESGLEVLEANDARGDESRGAEFGMTSIDMKLGGLQPGELITIAARPGGGKSVAALQLCRMIAEQGKSALFVALEMTNRELTNRLISGISKANVANIRQRKMDTDEAAMYSRALSKTHDWNLKISDKPLTLAGIRQAAKAQKARIGLDILVVDYIRLVKQSDSRKIEKRDLIAEVTQGLKELSKELDVPVIAVCQMNRAGDKVEVPTLSNLADSSSVEQDSDIVIFLHQQTQSSNKRDFIVAKHRHGTQFSEEVELNTVTMMFEQSTDWVA